MSLLAAAAVMCLELFIAGSANHGPWGSNAIHLLVVFVCVWGGVDLSSPTEKAMAPYSSSLAWKIPWTEEPGKLQSLGLRRVGHNQETSLSLFTFMHWRRK